MFATAPTDFASFAQEPASQEPLDSSFSAAAPSEPALAEPTYDLSFLSDSKPKEEEPKEEEPKEKKSLWKSFKTRQKKNDDVIIEGVSEEPKKKWGLSDKQKGTLKSGMGKFSNLLKTAAVKGQQAFKSHNEEPAEFPEFDVGKTKIDLNVGARVGPGNESEACRVLLLELAWRRQAERVVP